MTFRMLALVLGVMAFTGWASEVYDQDSCGNGGFTIACVSGYEVSRHVVLA